MSSHIVALRLQISADEYALAVRQLHAGNAKANPLVLPLLEQTAYVLSSGTTDRIEVKHIATGKRYFFSVPADLAEYLAGFRRGMGVLEDHAFELVLESQGD